MDEQLQLKIVDLTPALRKQFYPALLLLVCLTGMHPYRRDGLGTAVDFTSGLETLFQGFVSKLAYLCCTEPGGSAVAACAVLQLPDRIQYVFGFNDQSNTASADMKHRITTILRFFRHPLPAVACEKAALHKRALLDVLSFNQGRVKAYLNSLKDHLQKCIAACQREDSIEARSIQVGLTGILERLRTCFGSIPGAGNGLVDALATFSLIEAISQLFRSDMFSLIGARLAREEELKSSTYWSDCIHVAGRLLSYKQAVEMTLLVSYTWPQLFDDFEVRMIPSSSRISDALQGPPLSAETIARKMTSDARLLDRYAEQLQNLSPHNLNSDIKEAWLQNSKPIVHAEILVHHWLENTQGGIRPERFFKRWKFIGSSKPPCKLCSYFFDEYPTDVQVRPSHQNVYFPWRMPDIYEHQGDEAIITRTRVMGRIKTRICADIGRILSERLADGRPHDSSAYTTFAAQQAADLSNNSSITRATTLELDSLAISDEPTDAFSTNEEAAAFSTNEEVDAFSTNEEA
ncbi:hypothetical protein B0T10DRAFT_523504, partial [Thelonectria olida]